MESTSVLLLTGGTGSGKTMALEKILVELDSQQIKTGGMLAPGRYLDTGEKEFDLVLLPGREKYFLSSRIQYSGWQTIGGFRFNPEAVVSGLKHLYSLPLGQFHLYLLDEIGPFELENLLWAPAIPALVNKQLPMIWTVRNRILKQVCSKWDIDHPKIINLEEGILENNLKKIRIWLNQNVPIISLNGI